MELKTYFRILSKHWWVVVPAFIVTLVATVLFTANLPPVYSSRATFVVAPSTAFEDVGSFASGLEVLSRRSEIAATFGEVAVSRLIKNRVIEQLDLQPSQQEGLAVSSRQLAGTNLLEVTVQAHHPAVARDVANTVGTELIEYTQQLYEPYVLTPLDAAEASTQPVSPAKTRNYFLGGLFGLVLGAGLAFLADYLKTPMGVTVSPNIIDLETGAYNREYFMQRLGEEVARAKRQNYPLSVALVNIDHLGALKGTHSLEARTELLRKAAVFLKQSLREEDLIAYLGDATYAIVLPDLWLEAAKSVTERLQTRLAWAPFELERSGLKANLNSKVGVAALEQNGMERNDLVEEARRALYRAETHHHDAMYLATEDLISPRGQPAED